MATHRSSFTPAVEPSLKCSPAFRERQSPGRSQPILFLVLIGVIAVGGASLLVLSQGFPLFYVGLSLTCFVAGTVLPFLPGSSEMAMAGLLAMEAGHPLAIIAVALSANIAGASTNYFIGSNIAGLSGRWFPISASRLANTSNWFRRYGIWLVLMCWLPTAGDAITVFAGLVRADLRIFLPLTIVGKAFGHLAVAGGVAWGN
jgi:membrane protein YqaA with SNARE-associated domain